jgi:site-specific recombinase XerD
METIEPRPPLTDSDVIELWLARQRSPLTRSVYLRDIRKLLAWSGRKLVDTIALDLERFAEALAASGLAPISQGRTLAAIRGVFRFAERIGYCRNVAAALELPRNEVALAERILARQDVRRMIDMEPAGRNCVLLAVLYAAGLRVSEACGLRWRHLRSRGESGQTLVHGKGGRTRAVYCRPACGANWPACVALAGLDAPVFASRSGKPLERSRVSRIVKDACQRAGIDADVSPHRLRHAHASHALDRGAPIHLVQATMGHRSVATTSRYLHARPGDSSAGYVAL